MWCTKLTTKVYGKMKETGDLSTCVLHKLKLIQQHEQALQTYYITSGWPFFHSSIQSWCSHDFLAVSFCFYTED
jgi:hypothetical protein